ncbi:CBS domain-containing protein [Pseudomonas sp. StFLB209]|uniref:transporter associated domain-containing protein n=1 Tax=Pseudomonas sp. StFLB209 TaxID=1028989 RepID=UPI0004F6D8F7|nr:transporter associated domain-containing protein [Pseudomonas sp. StFLB209]BAP40805.1 CBS domain-containing protein [Pseudomonas sp. StFLB209]
MNSLPIAPLLGVLALLTLWSGLFTAAEAVYYLAGPRARNEADLHSLILGNTLLKTLLVVITLLVCLRYWVYQGPLLAWLGSSAALLLLTEYLPRRLASRYPQPILKLVNSLLRGPLRLLQPLAWLLERTAGLLLQPLARRPGPGGELQHDQVQPYHAHQAQADSSPSSVLAGIRALDRMTVNDILIPRSEVDGINLDEPIGQIIENLIISRHTRLPVYHNDINQVQGVLNTRQISHLLPKAELTKDHLLSACYEPYFVPESTPLQLQLLNFHKQQRRLGVVVDEYGEVLGIISLEDILEEIVGEFENEHLDNPHITQLPDGQMAVDGAASIRELNKSLGWHLPSDGPKTLNGLVTEALETIPEGPVCLKVGPYRLEILETEDNRVTRVLMWRHAPLRPRL